MPEFALAGVARTTMSDEEWADECLSGDGAQAGPAAEWAPKASFRYVSGGYDDPDTYRRLPEVLADCDRALGIKGQHVFYLATPPRLFGTIAIQLGRSALNGSGAGDWPRLVIEKPFGWDEPSARSLYAAQPVNQRRQRLPSDVRRSRPGVAPISVSLPDRCIPAFAESARTHRPGPSRCIHRACGQAIARPRCWQ
jgi:hypothetical protein